MENSDHLDQAMTPAAVVAVLLARGITLSERTLREHAKRIGACRVIGKTLFFMPSDIAKILEAAKAKPKNLPAAGTAVSRWTERDTDDLLRRVEGSGPGRKGRSAATRPERPTKTSS